MDLETRPVRAEQILSQRADDTIVLFNLSDGKYFSLDELSATVWGMCDGGHSVSEIISEICDQYDAPRDIIAKDILELLQDFAGENIVFPATVTSTI